MHSPQCCSEIFWHPGLARSAFSTKISETSWSKEQNGKNHWNKSTNSQSSNTINHNQPQSEPCILYIIDVWIMCKKCKNVYNWPTWTEKNIPHVPVFFFCSPRCTCGGVLVSKNLEFEKLQEFPLGSCTVENRGFWFVFAANAIVPYQHHSEKQKVGVEPTIITSWWFFHQPLWTICTSKWELSPNLGMNIKNIWVATT